MTEQDIKKAINQHSVKPLIAISMVILLTTLLNVFVFPDDPISSTLLILICFGSCIYIFQKVLTALLVHSES